MLMISALGLVEAHYLPRYGIEWMLGAIAGTVFLADQPTARDTTPKRNCEGQICFRHQEQPNQSGC